MASTNIPQKRSRRIAEQSSSHQGEERCIRSSSNNDDGGGGGGDDEVVEAVLSSSSTAEQTTSHSEDANSGGMNSSHTPQPHDVVCGRGGAINSHEGNVQFRKWVNEQRTRYALAESKQEKTRVAQQVIDIVRAQQPPGRFLQKDPSSCQGSRHPKDQWWVELDEDRVMAKTCQALREGATQIRAAHGLVVKDEQRTGSGRRKSYKPAATATQPHSPAISSAALTLVSSAAPPTVKNSSSNSPVNPALSGQKRIHPGSQNIPPPPQHQHQQQQQKQQHLLKVAFLSSPEEMNRQAAISQLRVNVEEAKLRYHDPMKDPLSTETTRSFYPVPVAARTATTAAPVHAAMYAPVAKRVRVEYGGTSVFPTNSTTPPLMAVDVAMHMLDASPPLNLSHDAQGAAATVATSGVKRRSHSFSISDGASPTDDWATSDFIDPFEHDDATPPGALTMNHHHHHHHHAGTLHHHLPVATVDSALSLWHRRPRHGVYHEEESRTDHRQHHHAGILHQPLLFGTVDASLSLWHQRPGVDHEEHSPIGATTSSDEDDLVALGALLQAPTPTVAEAEAEAVVQAAPPLPNTTTEASSASTQPQSTAAEAAADTTCGAWVRASSNLSCRSLTSLLSDLPDEFNSKPLETEFSQGVKVIYDALHQEDDAIATP